MKSTFAANLHRELRGAGAQESETASLLAIAEQLGGLRTAERPVTKTRSVWRSAWRPALATFGGLVIGALLVAAAQSSLPGSWLYPVKKTADSVAVAVHPEYRGVIMMQRAQAVQRLVAEHADSHTVLATLADYRQQAAAYKTGGSNYSVFEFCKANLRQAEAAASGSERQAISQTLTSLDNV